jgi:malto-oligosyltrehalose trehalohydrolase
MTSSNVEIASRTRRKHVMPYGAAVNDDGSVLFRLWAPSAVSVHLVVNGDSAGRSEMARTASGHFELLAKDVQVGLKYQYLIDQNLLVPDPASRAQSDDVHGPSVVIDPQEYFWQDSEWKGRPWEEAIIYELHVGTFSREGTFNGVIQELDALVSLGITAIELMPVADFPGKCNWGYDGVLLFAPDRQYGSPDDLKHLVDAAHGKGLMVIMDVVYNHFGPEGNYLNSYAREFFSTQYRTPWGAAIDFDGPGSKEVRNFFIQNALYWIEEFHVDALRVDAVHAICDSTSKHFITELAEIVQAGPGADNHVHLILEDDNNTADYLKRHEDGTVGCVALWNDDFHHALHVMATGESDGYYADYAAPPQPSTIEYVGRAIAEGFVYQGQESTYRNGQPRGQKTQHLPATSFVSYLQNHDQVGNRAFGERLVDLVEERVLRALTAIFLLSPQIPLLFMGEEWGASTPFNYFCDLDLQFGKLVAEGRRKDFQAFAAFKDPKKRHKIPDPCLERTFLDSVLNWGERHEDSHRSWLTFYKELIAIRKRVLVPKLKGIEPGGRYRVSREGAVYVRWQFKDETTLKLLANLSNDTNDIKFILKDQGDHLQESKVVFELDDCARDIREGHMPPWSVAWFMQWQ